MPEPDTTAPAPGLRERKKQQTRQALLDVAERLFEAHGYDHVTVAQIADGANISVKTLFTYFSSKEDLAFGDEARLRDHLVAAITARAPGESAVAAAAAELHRQLAADGTGGVEGYHQAVGGAAALQSRLRRMWADYEDALTTAIGDSSDTTPADARLEAMKVIVLVRSLTTEEVRALAAGGRSRSAVARWIDHAANQLA